MITRKPRKTSSRKEKQFIAGAGKNASPAAGRQSRPKAVMLNLSEAFAERVTQRAREMNMDRNAFISMCVSLYLDKNDSAQ